MNITFRQLRVFLEVAQSGSMTRAAESLHLTPPAVSMQVKELESQVGLPLFDREGRQVCFLLETDPPRDTGAVPALGADPPQNATGTALGANLPAVQVGGTPTWVQGEETPAGDWQLLAQIDSAQVPFWVNFGDAGIGYVFLDTALRRGCLLWQGA